MWNKWDRWFKWALLLHSHKVHPKSKAILLSWTARNGAHIIIKILLCHLEVRSSSYGLNSYSTLTHLVSALHLLQDMLKQKKSFPNGNKCRIGLQQRKTWEGILVDGGGRVYLWEDSRCFILTLIKAAQAVTPPVWTFVPIRHPYSWPWLA